MPMLTTLRIRLPVCPFHSPLRTRSAEIRHLVEHRVDVGHDVFAIDDDRGAFGRAERHVQDGPLLGEIDLLAAKHGVDPLAQAGLVRELKKKLQRLIGDAVLGVIEKQIPRPRPSCARRGSDRRQTAHAGAASRPFRSGPRVHPTRPALGADSFVDVRTSVAMVMLPSLPGADCQAPHSWTQSPPSVLSSEFTNDLAPSPEAARPARRHRYPPCMNCCSTTSPLPPSVGRSRTQLRHESQALSACVRASCSR